MDWGFVSNFSCNYVCELNCLFIWPLVIWFRKAFNRTQEYFRQVLVKVAHENPAFRRESNANDLINALNEKTTEDSFNFASCSWFMCQKHIAWKDWSEWTVTWFNFLIMIWRCTCLQNSFLWNIAFLNYTLKNCLQDGWTTLVWIQNELWWAAPSLNADRGDSLWIMGPRGAFLATNKSYHFAFEDWVSIIRSYGQCVWGIGECILYDIFKWW